MDKIVKNTQDYKGRIDTLIEKVKNSTENVPTIAESIDSISDTDKDGLYWVIEDNDMDYTALETQEAMNVPVGTIIYTASSEAPDGFLVCNGNAVGRELYPDLFRCIGTKYGAGDGSTTFNLPNLLDKVAWGSTTVGQNKEAGLPDANFMVSTETVTSGSGSAYDKATSTSTRWKANQGSVATYDDKIYFALSKASSVYGKSTTVQPPALTLLPCIKAFSSANVNGGTVEFSEIANSINDKLPLAGGTMTGPIRFENCHTAVKATTTDSFIDLFGGTTWETGGFLTLAGKDTTDKDAGCFSLNAQNGTSRYALHGLPSGKLTWGGKDIITSDGGTFNKPIRIGHKRGGMIDEASKVSVYLNDSRNMMSFVCTDNPNDANHTALHLIGEGAVFYNPDGTLVDENTQDNVGFVLKTVNNGHSCELDGRVRSDGSNHLWWNGHDINARAGSGSNGNGYWQRYTDGTQLCWIKLQVNTKYGGAAYSARTWAFPVEFSAVPLIFCTACHDCFNVGTNLTSTSSARIYAKNVNDTNAYTLNEIICFAFGHWK